MLSGSYDLVLTPRAIEKICKSSLYRSAIHMARRHDKVQTDIYINNIKIATVLNPDRERDKTFQRILRKHNIGRDSNHDRA